MATSEHNVNERNRGGKFGKKRKRFDITKKFGVKKKKLSIENEEIEVIENRLKTLKSDQVNQFTDFPLSKKTLQGLEAGKYTTPTDIQKECIGLALQGNDILGAAKTGSGKTLAFLIPILEKLYRQRWSSADGLGALIISPTRELVYQTFLVLNVLGRFHQFSGGVVFGAKDKKGKKKDGTKRYLKYREEEMKTIHNMNIVIGTPGRLRELMDLSPNFRTENLQILVLDEADLCLDLGFKNDMDAIIDYLPTERQTMLFSATQTKSVKDLARVNLNNPVYVSVHENAQHSTPTSLQQSYIVCELHEKMNLLYSFIKTHLRKKVLVFLATCKQVRYVYETFCKLRPGMTILALHGAMKQSKRTEMYDSFCRKQAAVMFATDIAARGLDFPAVHWVIQMDCPADVNTYIHRVGRTARYESDGEALLVLVPSEEEAMVEELGKRKIPVERIRVNPKETINIGRKLDTLCAEHVYLKEYAQRAHIMYLKSVFLGTNKNIFDVTKLDAAVFARSLGLAQPPRVRFLQREVKKRAGWESSEDEKRNTYHFNISSDSSDEEAYDVLTVKQPIPGSSASAAVDTNLQDDDAGPNRKDKTLTKFAAAKKSLKKNFSLNEKTTFDEDGEVVKDIHKAAQLADESLAEGEVGGIDIVQAKKRMELEDTFDKKLYQEKIRQMHREKRLKLKEQRRQENVNTVEDEPEVRLGTALDDDDAADDDAADDDRDSDDDDSGNDDDSGDDDHDRDEDDGDNDDEDSDGDDGSGDDEDDESSGDDDNGEYRRRMGGQKRRKTEDIDTGLSLDDDQCLALKLLDA